MWNCPLCSQGLRFDSAQGSWLCPDNHSFDRAREGYVNLLPANKKHSKEPGDSVDMIAARRRIHSAQLYSALAEAIAQQVACLDAVSQVLDLGCGEGYYSGVLQQAIPQAQICGVDISKSAIRFAAKKYSNVQFAVASAFQLPMPSATTDLVVRIFAPSRDAEILRVLNDGGVYLEVTPASQHLWELRESLYDAPEERDRARREFSGLQLCTKTTVGYEVQLSRSLLGDLVAMTPFAHRGHREKRESLLARDGMTVQMAFSLQLFKK